ncbi:hypothetical protein NDU88_005784 [Pleurodeles waltl]|uniref:Uncharacterized protein n=1 Tax=Pleurodeles waltl TaxID=8319 RepID=A0AAV7L5W3_PLEWA|nr:hypothetical protein NDU88_005784 [Pleurodeles waltl]
MFFRLCANAGSIVAALCGKSSTPRREVSLSPVQRLRAETQPTSEVLMTDWMPFEEEEYGQCGEGSQYHLMKDALPEAINTSVKQSICRALEDSVPQKISQALRGTHKPITQQLELFAIRQCCVPA